MPSSPSTPCPSIVEEFATGAKTDRKSRPPVYALTIWEAAEVAKISRSTLYKYIRSGALPAKKCGGCTLILSDDLDAFLRNLPSFAAKGTQKEGSD